MNMTPRKCLHGYDLRENDLLLDHRGNGKPWKFTGPVRLDTGRCYLWVGREMEIYGPW